MISVFNLEELQNLLKDFYRITNIRITVFDADQNELISYPENCAPFCAIIRSCPEGRTACAKCDHDACTAASRLDKAHIYRCHAGLTEAIMPLHVGNVLVGFLLFGHIFAYNSIDEGWAYISKYCENYPVDFTKLRESCVKCPHVSKEYIKSAARILHATSSYLVRERMATLQADSDASKLNAYLSEHFTESVTSQILCRELDIGRSKLYMLSNQLYGCGISQQVRKLRIEYAKRLLSDRPDMSITEIAVNCGYADYNYFITVFSRTVGRAPNAYRKQPQQYQP